MQAKFRVGGERVVVKENIVDRVIRAFDPVKAQRRFKARCSMALVGGYSGGSRTRRSLSGWTTNGYDADSDLLPDLAMLRERSRDLVRNTPIAAGAINTHVTNAVGSGLQLNSQIDRDYLGLSDDEADAWEAAAEREFNLWAGNSRYCDAASTTNFYGHHDLALRSTLENGDIVYLLPHIQRNGSPYDLKLQAIEADRICNEGNVADSTELAGGVQLDSNGSPTHYHIMRGHPGNIRRVNMEWDVVPAFGSRSGRRNVLHLFEQRRPGQRRGAPYLAPVIESLKQLGRYTDAELMAAVVSGMFTVFVKSESEDPLMNDDGTPVTSTNDNELELGNGRVVALGANESIESANPGRPNTAFDPFVEAILRQVGSALEIPYELLIKHFTASYSASRAAIMEAWKLFKKRRRWLACNFCDPVYEALITEAVIDGRLYAPGFIEDVRVRTAYLGADWIGPGKGQIQEKQEVEAAALRVNNGFSTLSKETAEMNGGDWSRHHRQQVKEHNKRVDDGLQAPAVEATPEAPFDPED